MSWDAGSGGAESVIAAREWRDGELLAIERWPKNFAMGARWLALSRRSSEINAIANREQRLFRGALWRHQSL